MSVEDRYGVIDIGSNSIRLVVFGGPLRAPTVLFNEKVMAGLGLGVQRDGKLAPDAMALALTSLRRFAHLARAMDVPNPRTVATAAVRQAENGAEFLTTVRALGLDVELLSGEQEAEIAALGVIAGIEGADGIVGDLGGGSLELARINNGAVLECVSVPLGILSVGKLLAEGEGALQRGIARSLREQGWKDVGTGLPFYLVGGSWRALAKVQMHLSHYPLPIIHNYTMPAAAADALVLALADIDLADLKSRGVVSGARLAGLLDGAATLQAVVNILKPDTLVVSATGVREGLLFQRLGPKKRAQDPLIVAARAEGERQGRFAEHGDVLDQWIAPLFAEERPTMRRLRHAACLLGDIGWAANPDFRAERGMESALHGNWTGLTAAGRALIGQALSAAFGGGNIQQRLLGQLASQEDLAAARSWGLAMRLAQRLSGGVAAPLQASTLERRDKTLRLTFAPEAADLAGEAVERRLRQLAGALGLGWEIKERLD